MSIEQTSSTIVMIEFAVFEKRKLFSMISFYRQYVLKQRMRALCSQVKLEFACNKKLLLVVKLLHLVALPSLLVSKKVPKEFSYKTKNTSRVRTPNFLSNSSLTLQEDMKKVVFQMKSRKELIKKINNVRSKSNKVQTIRVHQRIVMKWQKTKM